MNRRLKWRGEEYLLINGFDDRLTGAVATEEQFENFEPSTAHLFANGEIWQHRQKVGDVSEIEWLT